MAKREFPLMIFDLSKQHSHGECDFVVCTDQENGFVAKLDYVSDMAEQATDTMRVSAAHNGVASRIEVKRVMGSNPDAAKIRTLLRKAHTEYITRTVTPVNVGEPSEADMQRFLTTMIQAARAQMAEAKSIEKKQTIAISLAMLTAIQERFKK